MVWMTLYTCSTRCLGGTTATSPQSWEDSIDQISINWCTSIVNVNNSWWQSQWQYYTKKQNEKYLMVVNPQVEAAVLSLLLRLVPAVQASVCSKVAISEIYIPKSVCCTGFDWISSYWWTIIGGGDCNGAFLSKLKNPLQCMWGLLQLSGVDDNDRQKIF